MDDYERASFDRYLRRLLCPIPEGISAKLRDVVMKTVGTTSDETEVSVDGDGIARVLITKRALRCEPVTEISISVSFAKEPAGG